MKKIFVLTAVFPPEPVVSSLISFDIAKYFNNKNCEVHVFSPPATRPLGFNFDKNKRFFTEFKYTETNSFTYPKYGIIGRFIESISFGWKCSRYINNNSVDLIYQNSWPIFAQYLIIRQAKKYKIPVITHIQDIYPESITNRITLFSRLVFKILFPIDKYILKSSSHVFCISEKMKEYLSSSRDIDINKFSVVYNWQDESNFICEKSGSSNQNDFTYLYLGNLGPVAGVDILIDAFNLYNNPLTKLIIAGSGSSKQSLIQKVQKDNIKNILFIDVPNNEVAKVHSMADILLLPIKKGLASFSIPSKLPAYMLSSKPILASIDSNSDTARFITEANCGIITEPDNINDLANTMKKMYEMNEEELNVFGVNGFNYAMKKFSKKENLLKIKNIFDELSF